MRTDYFESSEFRRLLSEYEDTLSSSDLRYFDVDDFIDLADYYVDYVGMDEAIGVLGRGLAQHPDSDRLKLMLAGVHVCKFNYKVAEDILMSLDSPADNNDYYYVSAQLQLAVHSDYVEAERLFRMWIDLEDADIKADKGLDDAEELRRDSYFHVLKSIKEFVSDMDKCRELLIRWIDEYIAVFSTEAPLGQFETDHLVAELCRFENFNKHCEEIYTKMLDHDPYLENGWAFLAAAQYSNGKYNEAIDSAEYAVAVNPEDYFSFFTKAHAAYAIGDFELALVSFKKCIEGGMDTPDAFIASCLVHLGLNDEARPYMNAAEEWVAQADPNDAPDFFVSQCYELAECFYMMKDYGKTLEYANKVIVIEPGNVECLQAAGSALLALGHPAQAHIFFLRSVEASDTPVQSLLLVALRYIEGNCPEEAVDILERIISERHENAEAAYAYMAYAWYMLNDSAKFLESVRIAAEKCPDVLRNLIGNNMPDVAPEDYYDYLSGLKGE